MRLQVRIGEHFPELLEHLEGFKPEYRGRRLLALAAMQLAAAGKVPNHQTVSMDDSAVSQVKETAVDDSPKAPVRKKAPNWITNNAQG